jgi:acetyl-CoA carboxylase biotin carboxyl carrier protein
MEHDGIRRLARLMEELGLAELEVEDENSRIRLVRALDAAPGRPAASPVTAAPSPDGAESTAAAEDSIPPGLEAIRSPMVGTFWRAPSPDAPAFVSPGDAIGPGTVMGLVEAMKTMNEVVAESAARVVSVRPENGAAVEYGTVLFLVEPLA